MTIAKWFVYPINDKEIIWHEDDWCNYIWGDLTQKEFERLGLTTPEEREKLSDRIYARELKKCRKLTEEEWKQLQRKLRK